ncbi:hypothetical protein [Leuconostoc citreum]|uniref:hypothetical protein n=1 Tax=Leuconostoc citreum TaxID=33964 RepID=UPI0032DE3447
MRRVSFQAARVEKGKIVERDDNIYDNFDEMESRLKYLIAHKSGDWGFEEIKNA